MDFQFAAAPRFWPALGQFVKSHRDLCVRCNRGSVPFEFRMSRQLVPANIADMLGGSDAERSARVINALFQMTKLGIAYLHKAYDNK